jgi:predicted unusual protein kinase regulating ubiquinone biosynthesis (AarF/ABC1/UbiB family)
MVDKNTLSPVLLDFGLTKEVNEKTRFNFAKLLVAAAEQDIYGMLDSLEGVGLRLRTDVPFDVALLAKYFFRDANNQQVGSVVCVVYWR